MYIHTVTHLSRKRERFVEYLGPIVWCWAHKVGLSIHSPQLQASPPPPTFSGNTGRQWQKHNKMLLQWDRGCLSFLSMSPLLDIFTFLSHFPVSMPYFSSLAASRVGDPYFQEKELEKRINSLTLLGLANKLSRLYISGNAGLWDWHEMLEGPSSIYCLFLFCGSKQLWGSNGDCLSIVRVKADETTTVSSH